MMATTANANEPKDKNILILGDSLSAGLGVNYDQAWPSLLQLRINKMEASYRVINAGVSGDTTSGGISRLPRLLKKYSPEILILDEPTAGVDVELRNKLWENVKALNKEGVTIILTTHYFIEAQEMCDRIAIIDKGNLVALDTTEKLLERIKTKKIKFKVKNMELNKNLIMKNINFKINSKNSILVTYEKNSTDFEEIINYLNKNNVKIEDISTEDGDLEDVFVKLTKH